MSNDLDKPRQGIQSIEVGARLLRALANSGRPTMLRDLAKDAGMPAAKAHRYLVSFVRMGLVEQDPASSRYALGPFALELGLACLGRLDPVRIAGPILDELCEAIQETVALAVWGNRGPTIVRLAEPPGPINVTLRAGTVLPLTTSATGRAFSAFLRSPALKRIADDEMKSLAAATPGLTLAELKRDFEASQSEAKENGVGRASGSLSPGVNGFSAPVFDYTGEMVAAVTTLGAVGHLDSRVDSAPITALKGAAEQLSSLLGHAATPL
ncbi:IclR family transcriptional regulator [Oryzomicrobium sp.]|uniref:IclR family transcriptional regulator n=1 Tax=Oryzomicrobium sp. TaxID=1911578 RepID=UPI002FDF1482